MSLEDIKARAEAATEGPWEWDGSDIDQCGTRWGSVVENTVSCMSYCYGGSVTQEVKPADREFIANAREDVPKLIKALERILSETEQQPVAHERIFQIIEEATA